MPAPNTMMPEEKQWLIESLESQLKVNVAPISAALLEFWQIAAEEKVWMFNTKRVVTSFMIRYDYPAYPYGYFESNLYNGDVRFSPYAPGFKVFPDGSILALNPGSEGRFDMVNLPGLQARSFANVEYAYRFTRSSADIQGVIAASGTSKFWQRIFADGGPYDRSYKVAKDLAGIRTQLESVKKIKEVDFGFRLYNKNRVIYDSSSVTWNQVDMFLVPANSAVNRAYSYLANREVKVTQMFINPPPVTMKAIAHTVWIGYDAFGAGVSVYGGNQDVYIMVLMQ